MDTAAVIPFGIKLAYSGFMAVLVPIYLRQYGPTNFLYFCDVALLLTLAGLWSESALLLSTAVVGILVAQLFWLLDFVVRLAGGHLSGMTDYMFDTQRSPGLRALSLFHGWLPLLLLYLVHRTGYDPRALWVWCAIATGLLLVCYFAMPPPSPERGLAPVNINYVHGLSDDRPQTWVPPRVWLAFTIFGWPFLLYAPAHYLLRHWMPAAGAG